MIKKIRTNLTLKIFLITGLLLVFVCLISVLSMVKYVPETYTNQLSATLQKQASELAGQLETKSNLEDCYELIDRFSIKTEAAVLIKNAKSDVLYSSGETNNDISHDSIATIRDKAPVFKTVENEFLSEISFPFTLQNSNEQYLLSVQGTSRPVNQAIIAIQETIPLIILGIVILSTLCAVLYSRYITKPILELSQVSKKMTQLDFTVQSDIKRNDEIGILSESLNGLSSNLANTLSDLRESNVALEHEIERKKLLEKQQRDFFSAASHDLKTPLTILLGHLNGIHDGVGDYKNSKQYVERSITIAEQMNELVQSLLTIAKMENEVTVPKLKKSDLSELIRCIACDMTCFIEDKEQQLEITMPEHLVSVFDSAMIDRVIRNLLENAIKYSPKRERIVINLAELNNNQISFSIENTGVNISDDDMPHLFEPFYRRDNSRNKDNGGNGLGLYIVKMLLEKHHTPYTISNTQNGILFSFILPTLENPS